MICCILKSITKSQCVIEILVSLLWESFLAGETESYSHPCYGQAQSIPLNLYLSCDLTESFSPLMDRKLLLTHLHSKHCL